MGQPPTVFVVDDDPQVREAIGLLLDSIQLAVETFDSAEAFLAAYAPRPGCLVLDVRMPGMSGLELQRRLVADGICVPTIILTAHGEVPMAVEAVKAGALDFIEKPYSPQALLDTIHQALDEDRREREKRAKQQHLRELFDSLSNREWAVLKCLANGMNAKEIASDLEISATTVDFHRRNLMGKLFVGTSVELGRLYEAYYRGQTG